MKRKLAFIASIVLALAVSACGQGGQSSPTNESTTSISTEDSASAITTPQDSPSPTEKTTASESATAEPVIEEDIYIAPTKTTHIEQPNIWTEPGVGYQCAATDAWVSDPANCTAANLGGDPAYDDIWGPDAAMPADQMWMNENGPAPSYEGCPAAICGYGHNDQGERNPSSGEIQTLHGCQEGYITDPELCAAVAWVDNHQY